MHINPMISVKVAAAMLGRDKKYVREKLDQGLYQGEKRLDGDKERWFVRKTDIDAELASMPIVTPNGTYFMRGDIPTVVENELTTSPPPSPRRRRKPVEKAKQPVVDARVVQENFAPDADAAVPDNNLFFGVESVEGSLPNATTVEVSPAVSGSTPDFEKPILGHIAEAVVDAAVIEEAATASESHQDEIAYDVYEDYEDAHLFKDSSAGETYYFDAAVDEVVREALRDQALIEAISDAADAPSMMTVVRVMAREFAKRLDDHRLIAARLVEELEERNLRLRLLPDLQKKAEEAERLEFEAAAYRLQISCMEQKQFDTVVLLQRAEEETIPQLEALLEEEYRMHSIEVARLRDQIADLSTRTAFDENNRVLIAELEAALMDLIEVKDRERREAHAEIERIREERDQEIQRLKDETVKLKKEKDQDLAQIAQFTAEYQRQKEFEIAVLNDEADLLQQEKRIIEARLDERLAEIALQAQAIDRLESELRDATAGSAAEKQSAREDAERIAREMGAEINALNDRLSKLTEQLTVSQMPWWKRWFLPSV
jgi:hypothetical protein